MNADTVSLHLSHPGETILHKGPQYLRILLSRVQTLCSAVEEANRVCLSLPDIERDILQRFSTFLSAVPDILMGQIPRWIEDELLADSFAPLWMAKHYYFTKFSANLGQIDVEVSGTRFRFNANDVNRRHDGLPRFRYALESTDEDAIVIAVTRSRSRRAGVHQMLKDIEAVGYQVDESAVTRAIEVFEQQTNTDFFIAKDPISLLQLLLRRWVGQIALTGLTVEKYASLQRLQSAVEDMLPSVVFSEAQLVRAWQSPVRVTESHYVITMGRASEISGLEDVLLEHPALQSQIDEWARLGLVQPGTTIKQLGYNDEMISPWVAYENLPIDTKYFPEVERKIEHAISAGECALDGVLVHGDNYPALRLLRGEFAERVQTIYVDPPFNKDYDAGFHYSVRFSNAAWVTLLENRFRLARDYLRDEGCMFVRCDSSGNMLVRLLMDEIFGRENLRNEIHVRRFRKNVMDRVVRRLPAGLDTIFVYSKSDEFHYIDPYRPRERVRKGFWRHMNDSSGAGTPKVFFGRELVPPPGKHWTYSQKRIDKMIEAGRLVLWCRQCGHVHTREDGVWRGCPICGADDPMPKYWVDAKEVDVLDSNWSDIYGYSTTWKFQTENSEPLLKRVVQTTSSPGDMIMDFFLGSGTTVAVAHKMNRRWIGVEMGDHFDTIVLPRMKLVLAGEASGISRDVSWTGGGCFRYASVGQSSLIVNG
ncbi:MAG: site-specific DNA-methyltransferase [Candidatus Thorarchaeota archaeon]